MTIVKRYSTRQDNRLEQHELQKLAANIMDYGKIESVTNHAFSTNKYSEKMQMIYNGGRCVAVSGFGMNYYIQFDGLKVTEIIEIREAN